MSLLRGLAFFCVFISGFSVAQEVVSPGLVQSGNSTLFVPISVGEVTFVIQIFENSVPEDPGEIGDATIEGVDSDQDGVRDDLERYIGLKYHDRIPVRDSLYQFAAAQQRAIVRTAESVRSINLSLIRARDCVSQASSKSEVEALISDLTGESLNTKARFIAYADNLDDLMEDIVSLGGVEVKCQ
ncbi:hypothetical protein ACJJIW_19580 [Microbulbifer sp. JMSA004]|uniref:hypothetical protein n=1 Tax=unclassified Microbulbifer TaxID=2619833 RepID=UPI00403ABB46